MSEHYVYGLHAVRALLNNPRRSTKTLYVCQTRKDKAFHEVLDLAKKNHVTIQPLAQQNMDQRFAEFTHQGIVALASALPRYVEADLPALLAERSKPALILILDGITDPHNLGACLRTADAAGVHFVVIPKDKSASITPVVSKVACGAAESIPVVTVTNLVRAIDKLKDEGIWVFGAAGEAQKNLYDIECTKSIALVLGSEGDGLRRLTREHCDDLFHLPMLGSVESLNVSVATGICLYEVVRQRQLDAL